MAAIILSLWCVLKTHMRRFNRSQPFLKRLTFTIWMLKLQRGLDPSLIRSCGAKSNQSKWEQRTKPSPYKLCLLSALCDCYLSRTLCLEAGASKQSHLSTSSCSPLCLLLLPLMRLFFSSRGTREWEGWRIFTSYSSPCSHCLTLTSQYDTDPICLSPPDITTVLPAAGAWGLHH